jgi:hypothetical protein
MANQQTQQDNLEHGSDHRQNTWRESSGRIANSSGASDETYGLISVLYHALQGSETYVQYINDAERAGETEIAEFFRECQEQEVQRASRAKQLLAAQLDADYEEQDDEETSTG